MKRYPVWVTGLVVLGLFLIASGDTFDGRFTYQGRLFDQDAPASGIFDLRFTLFDGDQPESATQIGTGLEKEDIPAADGYFTTSMDFGPFAFNGQQRWLQIAVRPGAATDPNAYVPLLPLQELTAVPYALYSKTAAFAYNAQTLDGQTSGEFAPTTHAHDAGQIASGTLATDRFSALADLIAENLLNNQPGNLARNNTILQQNLNADMVDGLHGADLAPLKHNHSFKDLTGQIIDDQVPDTITIIFAASAGSALNAANADTLDSLDSTAFALTNHVHSASQIASGTLDNARFSAYGNLSTEGFFTNNAGGLPRNNGIVQQNLNADLLDGQHAASFIQANQANSITAAMIADGAVGTGELVNSAVTSAKLAAASVNESHLAFSLIHTGTDLNGGLVSMTNTSNGSGGNYPAGLYGAANGAPGTNRVIGVLGMAPGLGQGSPTSTLPSTKIGVAGVSDTGAGLAGISTDGDGVYASSSGGNGVTAYSTGASSADNGIYGETNSPTMTEAGVRGSASTGACGVYGSSVEGFGVRGLSTNNDAFYGVTSASNKHAGHFYSTSGTGLNGSALYAHSYNASGIALWAHNDYSTSSDVTAVLSNDGTGALLKGFGGDGGEHEIIIENNGKIWTEGGVEVAAGARVITPTLQITGGSDLSENFDIRHPGGQAAIQPGMVVCIDATRPGQLTVSSQPNDRKVAGIISGAGGIATGLTMGQSNSLADGACPVALTGRVYCLVDASHGAVEPGDLLTTSATPGHAMKVSDHTLAAGAILGKAMTALPGGKGLVLVLVSLQ